MSGPPAIASTRHRLIGPALLAILLPCPALPAHARQETTAQGSAEQHQFDIPSLPLVTAALLFSDRAGVQLLAASDITAAVRASPVRGQFTVAEALDRLLAGTGLRWRYLGARTITIERALPQAGGAPPAAMPTAPVRTFAPVQITGRRAAWPLTDGGSTDPTATEGTDSLAARIASVASKTPRSLAETPQSVSVLTQERLDQQGLDDIPAALQQMPGVSTRMVDGIAGWTYLSRGFEIHTFSFDGGGPTFYQSAIDADVRTTLDTPELAEFDHIEILRGAAGLFGGIGYPGGVINLQRKRPLDHPRLTLDLQAGSWNDRRIEADASLPIAFDGRVRARMVGVAQDRDFFYDVTHEDRAFVYGILEAEIGSHLLVRGGGSYRDLSRPGFNVSGLPRYRDGGDLGFGRDTCLCSGSNRYSAQQSELFLAGEWRIGGGWRLMANGTRRTQDAGYSAKLAAGLIERHAPPRYLVFGNAYSSHNSYMTGDATLAGVARVAGRAISLTAGLDYGRSTSSTTGNVRFYGDTDGAMTVADIIRTIDGAEDILDSSSLTGQRAIVAQYAPYMNLSVPLANSVAVDFGLRKSFYRLKNYPATDEDQSITMIRFTSLEGDSYRSPILPSFSATYRISDQYLFHLSYARIYQPQIITDSDLELLPAVTGTTYEAKLNWTAGPRDLTASLAVYYETVRNLGIARSEPFRQIQCCYLPARTARSYGLDFEIAGTIMPGWQVQASYNWNRNRFRLSADPGVIDRQQPAHQARVWSSYRFDAGHGPWSVGGGLRLESGRASIGDTCASAGNASGYCLGFDRPEVLAPHRFVQPLYIVGDLRISRRLTEDLEAAINITNIFDKRYYATVAPPSFGNYLGEPRALKIALKARFGS
ncbi:MAG: TonB-dependent receptor [Sphingomonas sp.]